MATHDEQDRDQEIDRRLAAILTRFPDRFSDEQIAQIRKRLGNAIGQGTKLRQTELGNSIGPQFDPRAYADG